MAEPTYQTLLIQDDDLCRWITINRPDKLNALNHQVLSELKAAISEVKESQRCLVLAGSGSKAFVAGADIEQMSQLSAEDAYKFARFGQDLTRLLEDLPQLTIARVQGFALGGGCELAMACDLIVAGERAKFGQPEVSLGLVAGFGGTQRLARRVGLPVAMDMLCAGQTLNAAAALAAGLVSRVVADEALDQEIQQIIKRVASFGPTAIAHSKKLARLSLEIPLATGLEAEALTFSKIFAGPEPKDGLQAFLNKRKPSFAM